MREIVGQEIMILERRGQEKLFLGNKIGKVLLNLVFDFSSGQGEGRGDLKINI